MSKKICVFLEEMIEDSEFIYPYMRLNEEGHDVVSVAPAKITYHGKGGMQFSPDKEFKEVEDYQFDAVIIPGGYAPDKWRRHQDIVKFVKRHYDQGAIIASICHGPWLLISANIVKGKRVTAFHAIKDDLINAGAIYEGNDMEEDGNLMTSTNPHTMLPMIKRLVQKLKE